MENKDPKKELYRDGLTIRDHFAGRALQAMLSALVATKGIAVIEATRGGLAETAYAVADAMLEERRK